MDGHHGSGVGWVARVVTGGRRRSRVPLLAVLVLAAFGLGSPGEAAFPGLNGRIAFTSNRDGNDEIYTMAADGSDPVRRTTNTADDDEADWQPIPIPPPPRPPPPPPPLVDVVSFAMSPKSVRVSASGGFAYSFIATPLRSGKLSLKSTNKVKIAAKSVT